ncbi:MAG: tetraacyldisaccharide 4'-kinase [Paludibacteraceae bacterium]|nr:tetraacyldisaccharide 4'-kinase [Paludibacteraceae bacterium]
MEKSLTYLKALAYPIGWIYALAVRIRNNLYDKGVCRSVKFGKPVISVGNITAGGTGKTPHVEYLLHRLEKRYKVAMVSRGYKRKSKGFHEASEGADCFLLGDEPCQIHRKHRGVVVAVDKDRRHAIHRLMAVHPDLQVYVLDDAFQYRKIQPGLSILLLDYNRMVEDDRIMPYGWLREPASAKDRADVLVISKCPSDMKPIEARQLLKQVRPRPYQKLFYSTFRYGQLRGVFHTDRKLSAKSLAENDTSILLCTAIAEPEVLEAHLKKSGRRVETLYYPDHHYMDQKDADELQRRFDAMPGASKIIVVTDKDAAKLSNNPYLPEALKEAVYCIPLKVEFLFDKVESFDKMIDEYVAANC